MSSADFISLLPLFLLGILGTGHCVGMCGPLTIAFPGRIGTVFAHLLYHFGRVTTYAIIGAILGFIGAIGGSASGNGSLETATHIQFGFSFVAALFLLLFGLVRLEVIGEPAFMTAVSPHRIFGINAVSKSKRSVSMIPLGLAMGLLPCGLSYAAFARAVAAGSTQNGALYLVAFGLGTLPGLLLVGTAASKLLIKHRRLSDIVAGLIMIGMAVDILADIVPILS